MTRFAHRVTTAALLLAVLAACATGPRQRDDFQPPAAGTDPFYSAERRTVFEDAGRFKMVEGRQCVRRDHGPGSAAMLVFVEMPAWVDRGTVILNGWDLRYLDGDHEVRQLRADITHSKLVTGGGGPPELVFEVQGELSDQNWDDAYEFCAQYTGIGFNSAWFDARIEGDYSGISAWALQTAAEGAVATLETLWTEGTLRGGDSAVVIPRGFNFQYDNQFECELRLPFPCQWEDPADHHLLQAAYSLFPTGASPNPDGNLHWVTQAAFKDDKTRSYWLSARAALIGGAGVVQDADLLPLNPRSGGAQICRNTGAGTVRTETVRRYGLPFDYAVPMLTGWELWYECGDQQVQRAGVWIHDIRFDPGSGGLEYKVSALLRDSDGDPDFNFAHRVTVLGLNRLAAPRPQAGTGRRSPQD